MVLSLLAGICTPAPVLADSAKTLFVSTSAPDLVIEAITWSPETPTIGGTVTFTVVIRNQGNGPADASYVAYYIDSTFQSSAPVNSIASGATVVKTFTWTAQAGSHTIEAVADSGNSVVESDDNNNGTDFAFSVLAPDLVIETITWSPQNPSVEDHVDFKVTIKNQGNLRASFSNVDLYIDGNSRGYRGVQGVDAEASLTVTFPWTAQPGSHTIKAVADILGQLLESDETNNDRTVSYSTAAPDLIVSSITWSPADYTKGSDVTFTMTIKNQGSGKADYSHVAYYIDDAYQTSTLIGQINAGATATVTFGWLAQADFHTVSAVADANSRVMESDETNNEKTVGLPVLAPDLIIQDITWSPSPPLIDQAVTFSVIVKNQGAGAVGYSRLYFYIDGDTNRWQRDVLWIDAGATETAVFHWVPRASSCTIKAVADGDNNIKEGDEANNTKTMTVTFSHPSLSDLVVQDIVWSPKNPTLGDTVTFTVSLKNQGSGQAISPSYVADFMDDTYQTSSYVGQMDPGAIVTRAFTWQAQAGSHTFKAVVDYNHNLSESNEANNEKEATLTVTSPDLVIQSITWSPAVPSIGDRVNFTMTVKNQGSIRAGSSRVTYYVDGTSRGYHDVPEIDAGAAVTTVFTWTAQADSHVIKAVADGEYQVAEGDESNNERAVTIPAPDLVINAITWSPESPSENATITFNVTVENRGGGKADTSSVYFYIDDSSEGYESVGEIEAGARVTMTFTWQAQAGSHIIRAVADGDDRVTESDESNNDRKASFSVSLLPPGVPATAAEPSPGITNSLNEQEIGVHIQNLSTHVPFGEDIILSLRAVNAEANPVMTVELIMQVPSGISVTSSEFVQDDKGRYSAAYSVAPGDRQLIEVRMRARKEGNFNIMGDLSYYLAEDKSVAEHQILTLPVTVGTVTASAEESLLDRLPWRGVWLSWWFLSIVVVLVGTVTVFVLRRRWSHHEVAQ
jgi:subtilase family serine protease